MSDADDRFEVERILERKLAGNGDVSMEFIFNMISFMFFI